MAEDDKGPEYLRLEEKRTESHSSWYESEHEENNSDAEAFEVEEKIEPSNVKEGKKKEWSILKVIYDVGTRPSRRGSFWNVNMCLDDETRPTSCFSIYRWYVSGFYFLNIIGLLVVVIISRDMPAYSVRVSITGFAVDSEYTTTKQSNWQDLWNAEMHTLAICQLIFVEIWTFVKVILLMVLWAVPLLHNRRAWFIFMVSGLAKWSFWTLFLVCFLEIAMYGDYTVIGYQIETLVNPGTACHMFALEVVWALGLAMFVLFLEEQRVPTEEKYSLLRAHDIHKSLLRRDTSREGFGASVRRRWAGGQSRVGNERPWDSWLGPKRRCEVALVQKLSHLIWVRLLFMLVLVGNCYMLVYSMTVQIVELDYKGIGGSIQDFPKTRLNLVNIGTNIRSDSSEESSEFLAFLFLFVNVFVPVFCSIIIVYVWFIKFSPITLIRMKGIVMLVQCWSSLEVYCLLVGMVTLNIKRFSEFAIENSNISEACDNLAKNHHDAQCLSTEGYILWSGMAIFIFAVATHTALVQFTIYLIRSNIRELINIALGKGGSTLSPVPLIQGARHCQSEPLIRSHHSVGLISNKEIFG